MQTAALLESRTDIRDTSTDARPANAPNHDPEGYAAALRGYLDGTADGEPGPQPGAYGVTDIEAKAIEHRELYRADLRRHLDSRGTAMPCRQDYGLTAPEAGRIAIELISAKFAYPVPDLPGDENAHGKNWNPPPEFDDSDPFADIAAPTTTPAEAPADTPPVEFARLRSDGSVSEIRYTRLADAVDVWCDYTDEMKRLYPTLVAFVTADYWDSMDIENKLIGGDGPPAAIFEGPHFLSVIIVCNGDQFARQDNRCPEDIQTCGEIAKWQARGARLRAVPHPYTPSATAMEAARRIYYSQVGAPTVDGMIAHYARIIDGELAKAVR